MSEINENINTKQQEKQINLLEIEIKDENAALNVLVGYLGLAQRRGAFAINESSKIYEAINKFKSNPPTNNSD